MPLEVRHGDKGEPWAIRTILGWAINGHETELNTQLVNLHVSPNDSTDNAAAEGLDLPNVHAVDKLPTMRGSIAETCDVEKYEVE